MSGLSGGNQQKAIIAREVSQLPNLLIAFQPNAWHRHCGAIGQSPFRQREVGVTPHHDGVPGGKGLETLQVVRQPVDELVLKTDGSVAGYGSYDVDGHDANFGG